MTRALLLVVAGIGFALGCGVKGPPLAPIIYVPAAVTELEVQRVADTVYLRFTVPAANTDGSRPADLERLEVYGLTTDPALDPATPPPLEDWIDAATLVATLPVRRPPADGVSSDDGDVEDGPGGVALGERVVLVETLTPELVVPVVFEAEPTETDPAEGELEEEPMTARPLVPPPLPEPPRRTYLIRGVSTRGRDSAPSPRSAVPLVEPTAPPAPPTLSYTETEILVEWKPAVGARLPVQAPPTEELLPAQPVIEMPASSTYLVYAVTSGRASDAPDFPVPLSPPPAPGVTEHTDRALRFGAEHCYVVRTRDLYESLPVQGDASPPTCVIPVDTFAPAAPTGLVAVASPGAISLVWDPSPEADVAGYRVLRGAASGATLEALTPELVEGTAYRDAGVVPEERYVYAVRAVDRAIPPNVSPPSFEVTEQAR